MANSFSLMSWLLFYEIVRKRWGLAAAKWSLLLMVTFPGSLFYQFVYSESLFFLLVLLLWLGLARESYGLACVVAFLLPLTRAIGIFCVIPILYHVLVIAPPDWLKRRKKWLDAMATAMPPSRSSGLQDTPPNLGTKQCGSGLLTKWAVVFAPFIGWLTYLALISHWTGNPFEGFAAQRFWGVHSVSNLWNLPKFILGWFSPSQWHEFTGSVLDRCIFLLLLYCLPVIWRLDKALIPWVYVLGILPAMSGTFTSFVRFASVVFPMFIALSVALGARERRWFRYSLLTVFAALHIVLVWRYVNFRWAG